MKKIILTIAVVIALQGLALAANGIPASPFTFKQSNNVTIWYATSGGSTATGQSYVVDTKHNAGDKIYAASNASSNIFFKTVAVSSTASDGITTAGESTFSGWSSQ